MSAAIRVAVEVGGTFTDLVWFDEAGKIHTHKVPSTPADSSKGVIRGLEESVGDRLPRIGQLLHASTIATNAVLERKGCRVGLLITRGFRDILLLQRQNRPNVYAVAFEKPLPLVSPTRVAEVTERMAADGRTVVPLDERALSEAAASLVARGVDALAVCFLHSYTNPAHERRAAEILAARFPCLPILLSSRVLPTFREYERASTTVMAAYLAPLVGRYLAHLEEYLAGRCRSAPLFIMQSAGGILPSAGARACPVDMLQSGPAAGVIAATTLGSILDERRIITLDMGGTSTDVCRIADGVVDVSAQKVVDGLPVGVPSLDIANVGSGGGSIGWIDPGGVLQVGPRSAGATPGPACYGHGGSEPTTTDAFVHLGWIRPGQFLGGRMRLDRDRAREAIARVAIPLGCSVDSTAQSIIDIAIAHINRCVRLVSVQRGYDPKGHVLCAYGGMGPMVAAFVADEMKIARVIVPPHPGLFSAIGLLAADLTRVYRQTTFTAVGDDVSTVVAGHFERLRAHATRELTGYGYAASSIDWADWLEMRYSGQGFELTVQIDSARLAAEGRHHLERLFHEAHYRRYQTAVPTDRLEIVTYSLVARIPRDGDVFDQLQRENARRGEPRAEPGCVTFAGREHSCPFNRRDSLPTGHRVQGLAIIEEPTATTIVPPGWSATVAAAGALLLEKEARA
jgi:N-methylhydantoinase A